MNTPPIFPLKTYRRILEDAGVMPVAHRLSLLWAPLLAVALAAFAGSSIAGETLKTRSEPGGDPGSVPGKTYGSDHRGDPPTGPSEKSNGPGLPEYPPADAWISRSTLHVQGAQSDDHIRVEISGNSVEVTISKDWNPGPSVEIYSGSFDKNQVDELRIYGLAGKDFIENKTSIPDFIWGGLGDDDIQGGNGVTYAFGQDGGDIISGYDGNDYLYGGDESDYIFGGNGSDLVEGNDDVDWLSGGFQGGGSDDVVDQLVGGAGGDIFTVPPADLAADILFDYDPMEDSLNE